MTSLAETTTARDRRVLIARLLRATSEATSLWLAALEALRLECERDGVIFDAPNRDECVVDGALGIVCVLSKVHGTRVYRRDANGQMNREVARR